MNSEILDYAFDNKFGINHSNPLGLGPPQIGINSQTVNKSKHAGYGYVGLATNSKIRGIMDSHNRFLISKLGELDIYKEWVSDLIDQIVAYMPEDTDEIEKIRAKGDWNTLIPIAMMNALDLDVLVDRFIKEQTNFHMSAKGKGLLPKDSHYRVNQNWQTIAKQMLTRTDVAMSAPEISNMIRKELGIEEVKGTEVLDYLKKAEQLAKDKGMSDTEWVDTLFELEHAVPYLWLDETLDMAIKMPLPEHVIDKSLMQLPYMFFTFEKPVYFGDYMGRRYMTFLMVTLKHDDEGDYISWTCDSRDLNYFRDYVDQEGACKDEHEVLNVDGVMTIGEGDCSFPPYRFLQPQATGQDWLEYGWIRIGATYPMDDFRGDPKKRAMNDFIGDGVVRLLNFLKTTAVAVETEGLPRSVRRDKNVDAKTREKELNVIKLRRTKYKGKYLPKGDGSGKSIKFEGTWWVTGHYRNQRYGLGRSKSKVIWIDPFMKGDGKAKKKLYKVVQ